MEAEAAPPAVGGEQPQARRRRIAEDRRNALTDRAARPTAPRRRAASAARADRPRRAGPHARTSLATCTRTRGSLHAITMSAASSRPSESTSAPAAAHPATSSQVAMQQRVVCQPAEPRPRGHHLDDERSAQQRAEDEARRPRPPASARAATRAAARSSTRECRARARRGWTARSSASVSACACSRSNVAASGSASARHRQRQVPQQVGEQGDARERPLPTSCRPPGTSLFARRPAPARAIRQTAAATGARARRRGST